MSWISERKWSSQRVFGRVRVRSSFFDQSGGGVWFIRLLSRSFSLSRGINAGCGGGKSMYSLSVVVYVGGAATANSISYIVRDNPM